MNRPATLARLTEPGEEAFARRGGDRYFNRELSWLAFNRRVLEEACNTQHPLLERLRFLSISGSNLDEFFMVRVAGLKGQQLRGVDHRSADGLTVSQQLAAITAEADRLAASQQRVWGDLRADLDAAGLLVLRRDEIDADAAEWLVEHFRDQVFPMLTPQALDPAHPFPFISNGGLSVIFDLVRDSDRAEIRELVMLPAATPRFIRLPGEPARFVAIEAVLKRFAPLVFPGYAIAGAATFRVLRDSDIELEEEAEDLVRYFANAIKRRRRGRVIRLELETGTPEALAAVLREELGKGSAIITETGQLLGLADLAALVDQDRPDLKFPLFTPRFPERIREYDGDCFAAIRAQDIVVHHPYETFEVVVAFLQQAAADPTWSRSSRRCIAPANSPAVVNALIAAAEAGKSVTAVVELKARFDEEQNLLGLGAGTRRCAGRLRLHRLEDPCQMRDGGGAKGRISAPTAISAPAIIPGHRAHLYRPELLHRRSRHRRDAAQMFNYITGYVEPTASPSWASARATCGCACQRS
jgi:polyphosphate kinase